MLVRQQKEASAAKQWAKRSVILAVPALDEQEVIDGGRSVVIYRRVAPPQLIPQPLTGKAGADQPGGTDGADKGFSDQKLPSDSELFRDHRFVVPVITVYGGKYSVLEWPHEGRRYKVIVSGDLNCLREVAHLELAEVSVSFFPMVINVPGDLNQQAIPDSLASSLAEKQDISFHFEEEIIPVRVQWEIWALGKYYHDNREQLELQWRKRQAYNEAERQWEERNPPQPEPTAINYFKIR